MNAKFPSVCGYLHRLGIYSWIGIIVPIATLGLMLSGATQMAIAAEASSRELLQPSGGSNASGHPATKIAEFSEEKEISSLEFSPDESRLAASEWTGSEVHIWKWEKAPVIEKRLLIPEGSALRTFQSGIRYSPDGKLLAIVKIPQRSDGFSVVRVWDSSSGVVLDDIREDHRSGLRSNIEFSSDGMWLLRSYDAASSVSGDRFFVHDVKSWNVVWSLQTAPFIPMTMSLSPNGKSVALGGLTRDGNGSTSEVLILDLNRRSVVRRIPAFSSGREPSLLQWSPNGAHILAVTTSQGKSPGEASVVTLDPESGRQVALESNAGLGVGSLVFGANGEYLIEAGERVPVTIWDSEHRTKLQEINLQPARLAISKSGRYLAVASLSKISVWRLD